MSFKTQTYGKWILCGEHSVLRGHNALVFPLFSRKVDLSFESNNETFQLIVEGESPRVYRAVVMAVVQEACRMFGKDFNRLRGQMRFYSNLPLGSGLGASAAVCVAIVRWISEAMNWISESEIFRVACDLENHFHGKSSGVDIAVNLFLRGIEFNRALEWKPVVHAWQPQLYLFYSGRVSSSRDCVLKVNQKVKDNKIWGERLDLRMSEAVQMAKQALRMNQKEGMDLLVKAINEASLCFKSWQLIPVFMEEKIQELYQKGALAVKPTGSGGGGYLLSLWGDNQSLPPDLLSAALPAYLSHPEPVSNAISLKAAESNGINLNPLPQ